MFLSLCLSPELSFWLCSQRVYFLTLTISLCQTTWAGQQTKRIHLTLGHALFYLCKQFFQGFNEFIVLLFGQGNLERHRQVSCAPLMSSNRRQRLQSRELLKHWGQGSLKQPLSAFHGNASTLQQFQNIDFPKYSPPKVRH